MYPLRFIIFVRQKWDTQHQADLDGLFPYTVILYQYIFKKREQTKQDDPNEELATIIKIEVFEIGMRFGWAKRKEYAS